LVISVLLSRKTGDTVTVTKFTANEGQRPQISKIQKLVFPLQSFDAVILNS